MAYDALNDLLLLVRVNRKNVACAVQLGLTATYSFASVKNLVDIRGFPTALILVDSSSSSAACFDLWWFRVVPAVTHLGNGIVLLTTVAADKVEVGPDLPVDFLPADSESFSDKSNELLKVPIPVDDVLGAHLSVSIDALLTVGASQYLSLLLGKEFVAVSTLVQVVLLFLEEQF